MTAPEDQNGLREALADKALRKEVRDCIGETIPLRRRWVSALIAGPIARLIAERDAAVARADDLERDHTDMMWQRRRADERTLAAEAEITRLKEGMEAAATRQSKIDFFGLALHSLGVGAPGMKPGIRDAIARNIALRIRSALSPKEHPHG